MWDREREIILSRVLISIILLVPGQGIYDTVVFIPVPTSYNVADINLNYESSSKKEFTFNVETAVSLYDANKFSVLNDNNNGGLAFLGTVDLIKAISDCLVLKFNAVELKMREKLVNKIFVPWKI